ncbi:Trichothecene efflux pump [Lachnellula willkommii]|uniref:Trichothecene efflux pump n=1 Tax=Lachnellula willkommii TaxID=215461 RepID=A0A559M7T5_9HELO|nr:Trichothecene efflux pump [Lachnellula willkommii]
MASINEKYGGSQDVHVESVSKELTDVEKNTELVADGEVTFKTKLAIFVRESLGQRLNNTNHPLQTLIIMYESYLFTQQMPAALLAYINADLGPDNRYPWIAISWNLGAAVIVTIGSRLSDIIGRRWFLIFGAASGAIGALVGATSQSITQSIVSGVIFGVGGGFQEMCFACAQELVPKKYRFKTLGYMIFANHLSASAILIGYAFVAYTTPKWRSAYWWCFAWELSAAILLFFFYHPPSFVAKHKEDRKTKWQLVKEIDYIGLILFTTGCVFILLGLNWGGTFHPWNSSWTIGIIVAGGICLVILGFWEAYMPLTYPILPPHLFVQWRRFTSYLVVCFVAGMLLYSLNVIWPLQSTLLFIPQNQTIIRGVYASLGSYGIILAGYYCVFVMHRLKHEKTQVIILLCIVTALLGSMASVGIDDKGQAIVTVVLVQGANLPINPLSFGMVGMHLQDQTDIGVAVGLLSTFRLIGGAVSTAIYTSIQSNKFASVLPGMVLSAVESSNFTGSFSQLLGAAKVNTAAAYAAVPDITNQTTVATELAVKQAHVTAYALIYLVAISFGCVAILAATSIKGVDENQRTSEVAAHLEDDD